MSRPTIYLSNWSSHRTPGHHGPGRKLSIMARPRRWEHGAGRVWALVPHSEDLRALRRGVLSGAEYFARCRENFEAKLLAPGDLIAGLSDGTPGEVLDGDTLCCACARGAPCHRQVAADLLADAGWQVVLDGAALAKWERQEGQVSVRQCGGYHMEVFPGVIGWRRLDE